MRVIDAEGKNLGVMAKDEALKLVAPGLDLIEIAPGADPPVARIMSYDKFRYETAKAARKERQGQKTSSLKHVQISARAQIHDLMIKVHQLEEFLKERRPVEIQMTLRGREKANKDWARGKLNEFLKLIPVEYKIISPPSFGGRGMTAQIGPK